MSDEIKEIKIYKLYVEGDNNNFYVGSSRQKDGDRFKGHQYDRHFEPNRKVYKYFNEKGGEIKEEVIARHFVPESEQFKIEQNYIDKLKPTLNTARAYTSAEMREQLDHEHKEKNKEKARQRREQRKQEKLERQERTANDIENYWNSLDIKTKKKVLNAYKMKNLTRTLQMKQELNPNAYDYEEWVEDLQKDIVEYSTLF